LEQVEISPVPEHLGKDHHITIIRDVTTKQKMELATAAAEAEALANRVKTETMQALSHDLRTPLQGIMGVTSTLLLVS
jgi:K+-sensing histidine kinase KdpD